jgi:Ca2+-transporting ATPase
MSLSLSEAAPTAPDVHSQPPDAVYAALGTSVQGLTATVAAARLAHYGSNDLPAAPPRPIILRFLAQFTNLFAVVLLAASAITFGSYFLQSPRDAGNLELAIAILAVVMLNAAIGFMQEYSAQRTAQALQTMVSHTARVIRNGELVEVPASELVPGDIMMLTAGDAICCDARLLEAEELTVDNVALTGESAPVERTDAAAPNSAASEAPNLVFMGTSVVHGTARAAAFATGTATEFGRIYKLTAQVVDEPSPLQHQVNRMAEQVSVVAVILAALLFAVRATTAHTRLVDSFVFALGVMVALVPEGLPATMSVSLAIGVRRMATRHALIKRLVAVETLGSTTVICTDKTGTLTKAEMTVDSLWSAGTKHAVTGVGYAPDGVVSDPAAVTELWQAGALCADARLVPPDPTSGSTWKILGDTTEGAIVVAAEKAGLHMADELAAAPRLTEFPFDSERKLMTTVHRTATGYVGYVKGSPQELLGRCDAISWVGKHVQLTAQLRSQVTMANDDFAADGLRVLGVAFRHLESGQPSQDDAEHGLTFLGLVAMMDPPRPEVPDAVASCRRAGIRIIMLTGDYGVTAEAIARRVGIVTGPEPRVVTGQEMQSMSDEQLTQELAAHPEIVFARVRPEHKLRVVSALKETGEIVAVTGDGVNDAPALKRADIGIAMGVTGTDVAREAALMVLLDDSFASIVASVELGRSVYANIRKFLIYLFSHNVAELAPILVAALIGFPLVPLSALQVLSIDLGSDVMPALALGAEAPEPGTMDKPPRPLGGRLFSGPLVKRFLFLGVIQAAGVCFAFFWRIHSAHLGFSHFTASNHTYREALTMTQVGIVVSQFFNSLTVRSEDQSVFAIGLLSNRRLLIAGMVGVGLVSCVAYLPVLQGVFNTTGLTLPDWVMLVGFGLALLAADEARKAFVRRSRRRTTTVMSNVPGHVVQPRRRLFGT